MPKKIDRSGWKLLPAGQFQAGWLEVAGEHTDGVFCTNWRLPDGVEREQRVRISLGDSTMGKKKAQKALGDKMKEFYEEGLRPPNVSPKATPVSPFAALLDRVWANRSADWKPNTRAVNQMYFDVIKAR